MDTDREELTGVEHPYKILDFLYFMYVIFIDGCYWQCDVSKTKMLSGQVITVNICTSPGFVHIELMRQPRMYR